MRDKQVYELADFVKEYFESKDRLSTWEKYKSDISFPDKIRAPIFFNSPIDRIKSELEEFEQMLKEAEKQYYFTRLR